MKKQPWWGCIQLQLLPKTQNSRFRTLCPKDSHAIYYCKAHEELNNLQNNQDKNEECPTFISSMFRLLDGMLDESFNRLKWPSNVHIHNFFFRVHSFIFKMVGCKDTFVMVLTELVDWHDKKPCQGKTKEWVKRRRDSGYFQNIFQELNADDQVDFKDKFSMSSY